MTLTDFITKWNGKYVDTDNAYGGQCMDLMHQWIVEGVGLADQKILAAAAAKNVYTNFDSILGHEYFEKIANTPAGIPQEGDIVFWGNGTYGHVAIFIEGDSKMLKSFDQNYPTGTPCHIQTHNYIGCLGWLHPKQFGLQAELEKCSLTRNNHWEDLIKIKTTLNVSGEYSITTILSRIDQLNGYEVDVGKKDQEIEQLKRDAIDVQSKLNEALQVNTEAQALLGEHKQMIEGLQSENEDMKQRLQNSEDIIRRLGDRIEELKESKPVQAYSGLSLIVMGIGRLIKRG